MENLETVICLLALIEFVTLICFFVLCGNVSSIKKRIGGTETTRMDKFHLYVSTGQIEHAKDILSQMIMAESQWEHIANYKYAALMDSSRKSLLTKYGKMLDSVGMTLDFELIDKINK